MKKSYLLLWVILLFLSCTMPALCKGGLSDLDAFETYIGKSRSVIRIIKPEVMLWDANDDSVYIVDALERDNGYLLLGVGFNERDIADTVFLNVIGCNDLLSHNDWVEILHFSLPIIGIDPETIIDAETLKMQDGRDQLLAYFPNQITCLAIHGYTEKGIRQSTTGCFYQ